MTVSPEPIQCFQITQATTQMFKDLYVHNTMLVLVNAGTKRVIRSTNDIVTVEPGQLLIFPSGAFITIENRTVLGSDYVADCISYPDKEVEAIFSSSKKNAITQPAIHLHQIPSGLADLIRNKCGKILTSDLPDALVRHKLLEPLVWLQSMGVELSVAKNKSLDCRLRELVATDLTRRWRVAEVARELGSSEATLRRRLKECGTSYSDILMAVRLEQGLAKLHSSSQSISQIAVECGFATPSHFSDTFKTRFSISPSAVRTMQD